MLSSKKLLVFENAQFKQKNPQKFEFYNFKEKKAT